MVDNFKAQTGSVSLDDLERKVFFGSRQVSAPKKVILVQEHFDTVSRRYDILNTLLSFGQQLVWKKNAVEMLGIKPEDRIIDVCGGTGDLAILAAQKLGTGGRVFLYDFNAAMLRQARGKITNQALEGKIKCLLGDAEAISLKDESVEAAMVGFGIRNLVHPEQGFREIFRVLRPGGTMMCLEFSQPTSHWFRYLYDLYSFRVMPLLGKVFVGSWQAYTYLPESIRRFPGPRHLNAILEGIGFSKISYRLMTNGIVAIHLARKGG